MTEYLEELSRIPNEAAHSIMIFEADETLDKCDDIAEVFSPPRIVTIARKCGLTGKWSWDKLVEFAPGECWDLKRKLHQRAVIDLIETHKPQLLIGSPPCSWFSQIMNANWSRISRARRRTMMQEAKALLQFAAKL